MKYTGSCYCRAITYEIDLASPDDARTSVCHCFNCKKFTGTENGITAKIPRRAFTYMTGVPKKHESDNGSGALLTREFCADCGSGIMEYGAHAGENTYVFHGTLDDPMNVLPPKGEFFMKYKAPWMPEIPSE
ncbi:hypothetical protein EWM64_g6928 [Hericium alpestre]|uniref:CENP-V/GFA domain-containing protein n=1 Tax=Hericium alpestre TaxID=135208 RepID=A0A4Y9ZQB1_9AGAM|nr:hypothetical protein EWM64_g6928 [Hericium alpestre]